MGVAKCAGLASQSSYDPGDTRWGVTRKGVLNAHRGVRPAHGATRHCHQALSGEVARPV